MEDTPYLKVGMSGILATTADAGIGDTSLTPLDDGIKYVYIIRHTKYNML